MVISLICLINLAAMWFYTCRYYKAMFFDRSSTTHVAFFIIISNAIIFLYRNYLGNFCRCEFLWFNSGKIVSCFDFVVHL